MQANERRRHPRHEIQAEVLVRTSSEFLPGQTLEISESGLSAILPVELPKGEEVELRIKIPPSILTTRAVVAYRNVYRHGFEFLHPLRESVEPTKFMGDCEMCGGTGFIIKPLGNSPGIAFGRIRCSDCAGRGNARFSGAKGPSGP